MCRFSWLDELSSSCIDVSTVLESGDISRVLLTDVFSTVSTVLEVGVAPCGCDCVVVLYILIDSVGTSERIEKKPIATIARIQSPIGM